MSTPTATTPVHNSRGKPRLSREGKMAWVPLDLMRVSPLAQRDLNQSWVNELAANMDLEELGYPHVNHRDGYWYIMDGQHRVEAIKLWDEQWKQQRLECITYEGLTEKQEAEKFLKLNKRLNVSAFSNFMVGVQAGRTEESAIAALVTAVGMNISKQRSGMSVSAVGTLRKVYHTGGPRGLRRTLGIIRDAYGQPGLEAPVIEGLGLVVARFGDVLDDERIVRGLSNAAAGVSGLLNQAEVLRRAMGQRKGHCVAAAAVDIIRQNTRRGEKRIPKWWQQENDLAVA